MIKSPENEEHLKPSPIATIVPIVRPQFVWRLNGKVTYCY